MTIITRLLKISIPFCLITNVSLATQNNTAIAKTTCFSKNLYQQKSRKCRPINNQKTKSNKRQLFSIYSSTQPIQKANKRAKVKPFKQWNKNLRPYNSKLTINKEPLNLTPDKYPNMTLVSNGSNRHAITILSNTKVAMVTSRTSPSKSPIQSPSLAALHIRCIENTTSVMFEFPTTNLADTKASSEILYSIDNGPDKLLSLSASHAENILGIWSGKQAVPFTSNLLGKSALRLNVWDEESIEYTFTFDVSNLDEAIHSLRNACNW